MLRSLADPLAQELQELLLADRVRVWLAGKDKDAVIGFAFHGGNASPLGQYLYEHDIPSDYYVTNKYITHGSYRWLLPKELLAFRIDCQLSRFLEKDTRITAGEALAILAEIVAYTPDQLAAHLAE